MTANPVLSGGNTNQGRFTRPERNHLEALERRFRHVERQINESDNAHHPRMNFLRAEESALIWALQQLTGERPERRKAQ